MDNININNNFNTISNNLYSPSFNSEKSQNIIFPKLNYNPPSNKSLISLSNNNNTIDLVNVIYDDEFIKIINSLSALIKSFYKEIKIKINDNNIILILNKFYENCQIIFKNMKNYRNKKLDEFKENNNLNSNNNNLFKINNNNLAISQQFRRAKSPIFRKLNQSYENTNLFTDDNSFYKNNNNNNNLSKNNIFLDESLNEINNLKKQNLELNEQIKSLVDENNKLSIQNSNQIKVKNLQNEKIKSLQEQIYFLNEELNNNNNNFLNNDLIKEENLNLKTSIENLNTNYSLKEKEIENYKIQINSLLEKLNKINIELENKDKIISNLNQIINENKKN